MKISVDSDLLSSFVKSCVALIGVLDENKTITLSVTKSDLTVAASGASNSCSMKVPCEVLQKGGSTGFSIDYQVLLSAIAKRKVVQIEINDSSIKVQSQRYEAELLINAFEKIEVVPDEVKNDKAIKLKSKFMARINELLPKLQLKPLMSVYDYIPFGIKATKDGTFISCFDQYQSAFVFDSDLTGSLNFTLPSSVFVRIAKEVKDQDYSMSVSESSLYAWNDQFELATALAQTEGEQITLDDMIGLVKQLKKQTDGTLIRLRTEGITSLLENAKSIYEKESTFTFETTEDKCKLHLRSSHGNLSSTIILEETPKKNVTITCDFNFFSSLLSKAPPILELRVNDRMMMFQHKPVTYLLSLV